MTICFRSDTMGLNLEFSNLVMGTLQPMLIQQEENQ